MKIVTKLTKEGTSGKQSGKVAGEEEKNDATGLREKIFCTLEYPKYSTTARVSIWNIKTSAHISLLKFCYSEAY